MFPDNFTDEDAEELQNAIYDFMHYRADQARGTIIMCGVMLIILVLLAIS